MSEQKTQVAPDPGTFQLSEESKAAFMEALVKDKKINAPVTETPDTPKVEDQTKGDVKDLPTVNAASKDDDVPASIKSSKAAEDWKKLKSELKRQEEEAKKWKTEYEKVHGATKSPNPELETLRKDYDALSEQLRILDIEKHPKFQAYFGNKVGAVQEDLKVSLGDNAEKAIKILSLEEGEYKKELMRSLMVDLDEFQQDDLKQANRKLREINHEKGIEIARAREQYASIKAMEQQEQEKKKQSFTGIFQKTVEAAKQLPIYQEKDGDEAWNKDVQERVKLAQSLYLGEMPPDELARAALWSAAAPALLAQGKALMDENESLRKEIEALKAAGPKIDGGGENHAPAEVQSSGDFRKDIEARARMISFGR